MAFSTATITEGPVVEPDGGAVLVWWTASDPDGVLFQLYVDRALTWSGTAREVSVPASSRRTVYHVGTVGPGEGQTDFSSSLPALQGTGDRALLTWTGGSWQEESPPQSGLAGYRIYGGSTPGAAVSYAASLGEVLAYTPGLETDGYGLGGYGEGGYGSASASYQWLSEPLANGVWNFAVKPYDKAGNEGTVATFAVTIAGPPQPPALNAETGLRLSLSYDAATFKATLSWAASIG